MATETKRQPTQEELDAQTAQTLAAFQKPLAERLQNRAELQKAQGAGATEVAEALKAERFALKCELLGAQEDAEDAFNKRFERGDSSGAFLAKQQAEAEMAKLGKALAAFDEAYPEVLAALKAEKAERTAGHERD